MTSPPYYSHALPCRILIFAIKGRTASHVPLRASSASRHQNAKVSLCEQTSLFVSTTILSAGNAGNLRLECAEKRRVAEGPARISHGRPFLHLLTFCDIAAFRICERR